VVNRRPTRNCVFGGCWTSWEAGTPGETAVVASHGNLIALGLHSIAPDLVDFAFWEQMPMPAVYRLGGGRPTGPGFDP
jgi:hypothetical protein